MGTGINPVSRPAYNVRKELVVLQGTERQALSIAALMNGGTFEKDFWTRVLADNNLESPGYHEASERTRQNTAAKKLAEKEERARKKKK